jgi:hypothetical protein
MGGKKEQAMERVNLYLPRKEKVLLEKLSLKTGETMSSWIRRGIRLILEKEKKNASSNTRSSSSEE